MAEFLPRLLKLYKSKSYQSNGFDWIDNLEQVADTDLLDKLETKLDTILQAADSKISLALPEGVGLEGAKSFAYSTKGEHTFLRFQDLVKESKSTLTWKSLSHRKLTVRDSTDTLRTIGLHKCLVTQVELAGFGTFVLADGLRYSVASNWIKQVDADVDTIPKLVGLPPFTAEHKTENDWCQTAAAQLSKHGPGAILDRKNIFFGGKQSQIEFCDYFDGARIIHAKRYSGAPSMSHLFAQARASAEGWGRFESSFRQKVNVKLPDKLKLPNPKDILDTTKYTIVLAIIGPTPPCHS